MNTTLFALSFGCLAWLGIGGCVSYQDRPLSGATTFDDFASRSLDDPNLHAYLREKLSVRQWPLATWNSAELTLAAFFYSPELDVARARWAVAQGARQTATERPNPTLGLAPGFNSTTGFSDSVSPWIVGAALEIPIETAGKRGYRIAEAEHLSEAARLQIAQAAWDLRHRVREALLDVYAATETAHLLRQRQSIQEDHVGLLETMYNAGEISANELSQARIRRDEAHLALLDVETQAVQARGRLAGALSVPAPALEAKDLSFELFATWPEDVPPAEAQRQALLQREDLLAALADYQASQSALQQEIARQYPDIQIGPGYEFDQGDNKWSLGLSVTLPVFNRNRGAIATAEARRAQAEAEFKALQARIIGDLEQAVTSYRASVTKVRAAMELAGALAVVDENTTKMYHLGEVTRLEVDTATLESMAGVLNRLGAQVEVLRALGQIEYIMHMAADLPDGLGRIEERDHE